MSAAQIWTNIIAYLCQVGLLVGIGAGLPVLLRLKAPRARLLYWQLLLVACLALPWLRPWQSEVIAIAHGPVTVTQIIAPVAANVPVSFSIPPMTEIALWLFVAGLVVRLSWLAIGLLKLARYRRQGRAIPLPPEWNGAGRRARLLVSDEISGPVTFGFFRPVVLLPSDFLSMPQAMRDAILFHELIHVERRDWLFALGEELVRAVFWFHPAIWWVLGEIQLAREQTVDRAVIEMTQARDPYVDTLLAMAGVNLAGVNPQMDLAPAPLFLRRRHLKQRVIGLIQEAGMSKTRMMIAQIAALTMMAVACWFVTGAIPLHAQAQMVADGAGVTVNLNGSQLMHRSPVMYPADAFTKGVEGTVVVQVRLDANGEVIDDAVLSGPDELRKGVQQTILNWHFDTAAGSATRVVNIDFVKPANAVGAGAPSAVLRPQIVANTPTPGGRGGATAMTTQATPQAQPLEQQYLFMQQEMAALERRAAQTNDPVDAALLDQVRKKIEAFKAANAQQFPQSPPDGTIERIDVAGLTESARQQLLVQLPVRVGDPHSREAVARLTEAVHQFDEHLAVSGSSPGNSGVWTMRIATPDASQIAMNTPGILPAGVVTVSGNAQAHLISAEQPVYPPLAKMARQQGTVKLEATIGADGKVQDIKVLSGPPLLIPAALQSVKTSAYRPTQAPVSTTIDVNFSIPSADTAAK